MVSGVRLWHEVHQPWPHAAPVLQLQGRALSACLSSPLGTPPPWPALDSCVGCVWYASAPRGPGSCLRGASAGVGVLSAHLPNSLCVARPNPIAKNIDIDRSFAVAVRGIGGLSPVRPALPRGVSWRASSRRHLVCSRVSRLKPNCSHLRSYAIHGFLECSELQLTRRGAETAATAIMPISRMGTSRLVPPSATATVCPCSPRVRNRAGRLQSLGLPRLLSERVTFSAYRSQRPIGGALLGARPILNVCQESSNSSGASIKSRQSRLAWHPRGP